MADEKKSIYQLSVNGTLYDLGVNRAVKTMPTPVESLVGSIFQYEGDSTTDFTQGKFYKCVDNSGTYSWQFVDCYVTTDSSQTISGAKTFSNTNTFSGSIKSTGTNTFSNTNTFSGSISSSGANTFSGVNTFTQTIQGEALYAKWGDLAEMYETDKQYPAGTLLQFGGEKEMTIAHNSVNAIVSTKPGLLINNNTDETSAQPIALTGKVPVRVIGKVKKFDRIMLSSVDGIAIRSPDNNNVIGVALEDNLDNGEKLVLCSVKLTF